MYFRAGNFRSVPLSGACPGARTEIVLALDPVICESGLSDAADLHLLPGHPDIVQKSIMLHNEPKSALHVIFENVTIQDDARTVNAHCAALLPSYGCEYALIVSPDSYGAFVRRISITDPLVFTPVAGVPTASTGDESGLSAVSAGDSEDDGLNRIRPIPANYFEDTLRACVNLEEFSWQSSAPPPDGICEVSEGLLHRTRSLLYFSAGVGDALSETL